MNDALAKLVALLTPKRRWAQFSLATMFIVVTALCVWLGDYGARCPVEFALAGSARRGYDHGFTG
ncbi:MAG TPA: hypothetical protein VND64_18200 [Pirellulales bacterium]|nr:hypothetical protein [Pirellulales bacterium]